MFALDGVAGVAVVTGRSFGGDSYSLVVRDFDIKAEYTRSRRTYHSLAAGAPTVRTHRGRNVLRPRPWERPVAAILGGRLIADKHQRGVVGSYSPRSASAWMCLPCRAGPPRSSTPLPVQPPPLPHRCPAAALSCHSLRPRGHVFVLRQEVQPRVSKRGEIRRSPPPPKKRVRRRVK